MPETGSNKTIFSLLEVTTSIQKTLASRYGSFFWVKAEMNKLNLYKHSGHCYPELVEKSNGRIVAQIKSTIWRDDYLRINQNFQRILKEPLKDGIKILFQAKISYDPVHGLSLWITDIDPGYTLGDLEKEKQQTIERLKEEGLFFRNKMLEIPLLPQRIAIISVESSKGYADFLRVIETNPWNYKFFHLLFPSVLQGDKVVYSIVFQLQRIRKVKHHFDVVAIVRGGGGDIGLSCYNSYKLTREIAMFPIPVLTGIGHATNETVTEMISFLNAITPTKLAEYLLQSFHNFSVPVQEAQRKLAEKSKRIIREQKTKFQAEVKTFRLVTENTLAANRRLVKSISTSVFQSSQYLLKGQAAHLRLVRENIARGTTILFEDTSQQIRRLATATRKDAQLELNKNKNSLSYSTQHLVLQVRMKLKSSGIELINLQKNIDNMDPVNVLKRGYSITSINGRSITDPSQVNNGDVIITKVFGGEIVSTVDTKQKTKEQ